MVIETQVWAVKKAAKLSSLLQAVSDSIDISSSRLKYKQKKEIKQMLDQASEILSDLQLMSSLLLASGRPIIDDDVLLHTRSTLDQLEAAINDPRM